jgi:hypothetical protein
MAASSGASDEFKAQVKAAFESVELEKRDDQYFHTNAGSPFL